MKTVYSIDDRITTKQDDQQMIGDVKEVIKAGSRTSYRILLDNGEMIFRTAKLIKKADPYKYPNKKVRENIWQIRNSGPMKKKVRSFYDHFNALFDSAADELSPKDFTEFRTRLSGDLNEYQPHKLDGSYYEE
jgi:hypothetical protein